MFWLRYHLIAWIPWRLNKFTRPYESLPIRIYRNCSFAGHCMFEIPIIQESTKVRSGLGILVSEFISTCILLAVILLGEKEAKDRLPMLVALTVTAGYWFTSSTFFANPAVALARSLTNTFVGIAPASVLGFVVAEILAATLIIGLLIKQQPTHRNSKAFHTD